MSAPVHSHGRAVLVTARLGRGPLHESVHHAGCELVARARQAEADGQRVRIDPAWFVTSGYPIPVGVCCRSALDAA